MTDPNASEIDEARRSVVSLLRQEFNNHTLGQLDPYEFGNAVAPLVNALAALTLMEKDLSDGAGLGEASRSDD
ncbi:SLT domain-containing protein [Methylopila capsulata]|uniref:SLT domain-containing protein n=1 Tax=Methylopila capsulata TaxID=61654 RepID=A0A9W6IVN3_9HYPH|nr:hypothetical protein [Methylopila capsulata]MBM7853349.1 SLT domain-containing protein [Methylopila capsulata]GLK57436.1 hypothetical protein GCM10008170_34560 [Methylopila capsulata]